LQIEKKAAEYFKQKKYGKTLSTLMEVVYDKGLKPSFYKMLMRIFTSSFLKDVEYPNDFQVEVLADREVILKNRLNQIRIPVFIISGERDIGYSFEDVKTTKAEIPDAILLSYKNYGHDLYGSKYREINERIKYFLKK